MGPTPASSKARIASDSLQPESVALGPGDRQSSATAASRRATRSRSAPTKPRKPRTPRPVAAADAATETWPPFSVHEPCASSSKRELPRLRRPLRWSSPLSWMRRGMYRTTKTASVRINLGVITFRSLSKRTLATRLCDEIRHPVNCLARYESLTSPDLHHDRAVALPLSLPYLCAPPTQD